MFNTDYYNPLFLVLTTVSKLCKRVVYIHDEQFFLLPKVIRCTVCYVKFWVRPYFDEKILLRFFNALHSMSEL